MGFCGTGSLWCSCQCLSFLDLYLEFHQRLSGRSTESRNIFILFYIHIQNSFRTFQCQFQNSKGYTWFLFPQKTVNLGLQEPDEPQPVKQDDELGELPELPPQPPQQDSFGKWPCTLCIPLHYVIFICHPGMYMYMCAIYIHIIFRRNIYIIYPIYTVMTSHSDVTGMIVRVGNHPQVALFHPCSGASFVFIIQPDIYLYIQLCIAYVMKFVLVHVIVETVEQFQKT